MFELADRLVGVYKTDNAVCFSLNHVRKVFLQTKSISIDPRSFVLPAAGQSSNGAEATTASAAGEFASVEEAD